MRICGCHGLFHIGSMALVPFKYSANANTAVHVLLLFAFVSACWSEFKTEIHNIFILLSRVHGISLWCLLDMCLHIVFLNVT